MKTLAGLLLACGTLLLCACSQQGQCDNILQTHHEYWVCNVALTSSDSVFHSERYPLDSSSGISYAVTLSLSDSDDEEDKAVTETPPRQIHLVLTANYTQYALFNGQEDSLIPSFGPGGGGGGTGFQWIQSADLVLPSLKKGTYAFSPGDTASGLKVDYLGQLKGGPYNGFATRPESVEYSGYIRIDQTFTATSGKFSYYLRVKNKLGQVTVFSGSADFQGFTHYEECYM